MKTKILLLSFLMVSAVLMSHAAVISVVNGDNLQTKINDATAGDVLVVGPGVYNENNNITLTKKLTILGPGYFKSGGTAFIYQLFCNPGSEGSYISGMEVQYDVYVAANNVTIIRNLLNRTLYMGYNQSLSPNLNNIKILQNYFNGNTSTDLYLGYTSSGIQSNYLIANNLFKTNVEFRHSNSSTGLIVNNVFDLDSNNIGTTGGIDFVQINGGGINNVSFYNNIFRGGFVYSDATNPYTLFSSNYTLNHPLNFKYNVYTIQPSGYTIPSGNLLTTAPLLTGYPTNLLGLNNADGRSILAPGSPAVNFGRKAPYASNSPLTDAGAFGGDQPYKLSGIPVGPYIYEMQVPQLAAVNSIVPIKVKARSNN
jgi:hypothetical protein